MPYTVAIFAEMGRDKEEIRGNSFCALRNLQAFVLYIVESFVPNCHVQMIYIVL